MIGASIRLYSGVPIDKNGENQVYAPDGFSTQIEKYRIATLYDFSFIRNDDRNIPIRLPGYSNEYIKCNYLQISNSSEYPLTGGPQTVFGFINNVQYINDNCTYIYWEVDWFQTWIYKLDFGTCLVERASVPPEQDTIGSFLLPEPISVPAYIYDTVNVYKYPYKWHIYTSEFPRGLSDKLPDGWQVVGAGALDNKYSACYRFDSPSLEGVQQIIDAHSKAGMLEAIVAVFASVDLSEMESISVNFSYNTIHGIQIKNKKCFTYPYNSIIVSGPGFAKEYRPEKFELVGTDSPIEFKLKTIIQPNGVVIVYPVLYNGSTLDTPLPEDTISIGGFRQAAYSADTYMNSMVQNLPTLAIGAITSAIAGPEALAVFGARQAASHFGDFLVPHDIGGNANASSVFFADDVQITIGTKTPTREVVRLLDQYFTMYGYNVQVSRRPLYFWESKGDRKFVYIKTSNIELHGQVPKEAIEYISNLFNNGVRLWEDESQIGNYD